MDIESRDGPDVEIIEELKSNDPGRMIVLARGIFPKSFVVQMMGAARVAQGLADGSIVEIPCESAPTDDV